MVRATAGALALFVLLIVATQAAAQSRLVVMEFVFDEDRRYEDLVADELLFRGNYELVPYEQFRDEVNDYGVEMDAFLGDAGLVSDLAGFLEYDAIIHGALDRRRRPRALSLTVYSGASGEAVGTREVPVSGSGDLEDQPFDAAMDDVEGWISGSGRGGGSARTGGREPAGGGGGREPSGGGGGGGARPSFLAEDETPVQGDSGWLRFDAGLDIVQRNFSLSSAEAGIQYDSGFYPGLEGSLEVYPVRAFSPGSLDGLGLRLRVARYFVDTTLVLEDQSLDVPTRHKEFGISLLYRHTLGPVELVGTLGYEKLAFTLGDNAVYESSQYDGIAIGIGGWYAVLANLFRVGLNVEIRPSPSLGDGETAAFGAGSAFGLVFGVGVEVTPVPRFSVLGFYRFRQYSNTYDGAGESDLQGELDATDQYHALGLRLGYAY